MDEYGVAKEKYRQIGVDTESALEQLGSTPVSIHCWQLDDVAGFESSDTAISGGGILSTGSYPGKARNIKEMMNDLEKVLSLIPGKKKVNIHAIYGDFQGKKVGRAEIRPEHFESWVKWAKENEVGLDFNPSLFGHPLAESGYTLANQAKEIRDFWIEHVKRSREISNYIGEELGITCINDIWIPDGSKDNTVTRLEHRQILKDTLDEIFEKDYPEENMMDAVECKLFGIGLESYTVGSNEFYLSYAIQKGKLITLDTGHFHPTEQVSDKISAVLPFVKGILLHLSRGVRWDSDHVTTLSEEIVAIMQEIVRASALDRLYIGTDYFDGSINRIGALALGARIVKKALLFALLEPTSILREYEISENFFARLALLEDLKTAPAGQIWEKFCNDQGVPGDFKWAKDVMDYNRDILNKR
ncbi:L-rhamnose isomerase [Actinomycetota bacterium]